MEEFNESLQSIQEKVISWGTSLIESLPNIILAAIVIGIGILLSRYVKKYFRKVLRRLSVNPTVVNFAANLATAVFLLLVLFLVLSILNLDKALTSLLAGAGVLGLAVGLAVQDPLTNMFSGILMTTRKFYNVGDLVETNGFFGTIQKISLRSTVIETPQGQEVVIPNKQVIQNPFKNYSSGGTRRVDLSCGVSYGDDLQKVKEVTLNTIREEVGLDTSQGVEFFFTEFGSSSINFVVRFYLKHWRQGEYLQQQSEAIIALKKAFDNNDITIPFPIRTLDFGIKGGEKLNEVISLKERSLSSERGSDNAN